MSKMSILRSAFLEALRDETDLKGINPDSAGGDMLTDAYYTIGAKNPNGATQFANQAKRINDIGQLKKLKDSYYKRYGVKDSDNIYESEKSPKERFDKVVTPVFKALRYQPRVVKVDDNGITFQLYRNNKPVGKRGMWAARDLMSRTFNDKLRNDVLSTVRKLVPEEVRYNNASR